MLQGTSVPRPRAARTAHDQWHADRDQHALSPHGIVHTKHRDHYGVSDDDVLVVQGSSKAFNPSLADAALLPSARLIPLQR